VNARSAPAETALKAARLPLSHQRFPFLAGDHRLCGNCFILSVIFDMIECRTG
jgi:hypothetical protein